MDRVDKRVEAMLNERALATIEDRGGHPSRQAALQANAEMRKGRVGGVPDDWGYVALNVPVSDMRILQVRFPELASPNADVQHRAWQRFIRSPESAPYKVRRNDGRRMPVDGIIVK
jgi:hypothetical protein